MDFPFVSIIIPTFNSEQHLEECLKSILSLNYPKKSYEVIVVDGGSTDKTLDIAKSFKTEILRNPFQNAAAGRNIGISNSKGEYLAFTDSDCYVDKNWLINAINLFQLNIKSNVACVGGPNFSPDLDSWFSKAIAHSQHTFIGSGGSPQSLFSNKEEIVYSLPNCNAIYKKKIVEEVGEFDISFRIGQDADLNFRISKLGFKFLYSPKIIVWHHRRSSIKKFLEQMFGYGYAMALLTRKYKKVIRWYPLLSTSILCFLIASPLLLFLIPNVSIIYWYAALFYCILLSISSLSVLIRFKSKTFLFTPVILTFQHFTYSLGFLLGMLDINKTYLKMR